MFSPPMTRAQSLAADVEQMVRDQHLQAGDRIATMDELRERTKLGRATISEAARLLAERGGVEVRPGRGGGLFVAQTSPMVRLRHTLLAVGDDAVDIEHALAVRDAVEGLIAVDAALYRTDGDLADLDVIIAAMDAAVPDRQKFLGANWELHRRIAAITPNDLARGIYLSTMERVAGLPGQADVATANDEAHYLQERADVHRELVASIASADLDRVAIAVERHRDDNR